MTRAIRNFPPRGDSSELRHCRRCGSDKPLDEFARDASKASGHKSICKGCDSRKARSYYRLNRESVKQRTRANYHRSKGTG